MLLSASAISLHLLASADDKIILEGASLVPIATTSRDHSFWSSSSGYFSFGFYSYGKGYAIGIWLVGAEKNTTVWTSNRDSRPILTSSSPKVVLDNGKLVLTRAHEPETHVANSSFLTVFSASMLDNGNFVLYNKNNKTIWQSFDYPTDTILQGQFLATGARLYSNSNNTNHGTGTFHLDMQGDGNLVLYGRKDGDRPQDAYWATNTAQSRLPVINYTLYLNETGLLAVLNRNYGIISSLNDDGTSYEITERNGTIFRATLDADGIFRLYSHRREEETENLKESMVWSSIDNPCQVRGTCGLNSYCTTVDAESKSLCIPGTDYADSIKGSTPYCLRKYPLRECRDGGKENTTSYNIKEMENMYWSDNPYAAVKMYPDQCRKSCLEDCYCGVALYYRSNGLCTKHQLPLKYVRRDFSQSTTAFFKFGDTITIDSNNTLEKTPKSRNQGVTKNNMVQIIVLVLGFTIFSLAALAIFGIYAFKIRDLRYKRLMDIGNLSVVGDQLTLRVFSYNDLKRATNGFKEELGKGSFGAVYKGALNRGRKLVAVKRLEKLVEEGESEFLSEMRAIGRANHKNIVRLLGYCAEGSKRLLVYEYMSYGSLANLLFKKESKRLDWEERVRIAIDVARGILYLHEECKTPIIHCDIKPQNILMDDFWTAKISDFGLAKLLMPDQTRTMTRVRGTRGYLAPEWQKNIPISVKTDVYSYGIVLLEIICCRNNLEVNVEDPDEIVLANWVYKCFVSMELDKLVIGEEVDKKTLENMVKVGLWCIQDDPALRPSMKSVMLINISEMVASDEINTSTLGKCFCISDLPKLVCNGFAVGIWIVNQTDQTTIVWTANRDDPPVSSMATLELTTEGLSLRDNKTMIESKVNGAEDSNITSAALLDSGSFVLYSNDSIIWDSFDYPTDTILGGQNLSYSDNTQLVSSVSTTNHSSGKFSLLLKYDGNTNLALYLVEWSAFKDKCRVKGVCGLNSYCSVQEKKVDCYCYPGFAFINPMLRSTGCYRKFTRDGCKTRKDDGEPASSMINSYNVTPIENMLWDDSDSYSDLLMEKKACSYSCLADCDCWAALHTEGHCRKCKLPLKYGRLDQSMPATAFLKMVHLGNYSLKGQVPMNSTDVTDQARKSTILIILGSSLGSIAFFCSLLAVSGFLDELGRGLFGAVYKGTLLYGGENRAIAVKRLEKFVEEGIREFRAEMSAIGRTHHRNLVQLLGFCIEDSKMLLVYEFMSNGSLSDLLFKATKQPSWKDRVRLIQEVAKGVLYLHEECAVHIIHGNLKSQNILLDESWTAKISDFGFSRLLLMPSHVQMSKALVEERAAYSAPEWQKNAVMSVKVDVFSFGVVLLETIFFKMNTDVKVSENEEMVLYRRVYNWYKAGELLKLVEGERNVDVRTLERLVRVGLWCTQDDPDLRPLMKTVILMLEGTVDVPRPPT
ncbi:hypothetical protein F8388_017447 [Cannabis sativa]|uniref:non-specific serine/threonine protein kinase n=1 Tax=Cannabis sativa TaxID=3483 RepID=A0A7J6DYC9_CANSA|nr:hypothetical protein F8388_017447 [Cannabis sativa]